MKTCHHRAFVLLVIASIALSASITVDVDWKKIRWNESSVSNSMCWVNIVPHEPAKPMKCPHTLCLNSTFKVLQTTKLSKGSYYGCGDTFLCSSEGKKTFCDYINRISPFTVKSCDVSCCDGDRCNMPTTID